MKKQLRRELLARRKTLPEEYLCTAGEIIQDRVLTSPAYATARSLFVYVGMPGEPPTDRIIRQALADGKSVFVPKCVGKTMLAVRIGGIDELHPGTMGIPEPQDITETKTADKLDLILVPCVSASTDGRRLGHGGGYYDRFLIRERDNTVCLCFAPMLCSDIPVEDNDVRIPTVITELP